MLLEELALQVVSVVVYEIVEVLKLEGLRQSIDEPVSVHMSSQVCAYETHSGLH